jgi:secondary thiamine-phosphate synthase enzyme
MSPFIETIDVKTKSSFKIVNITNQVKQVVQKSKISEGSLIVFTPHTTCAITINEDEPGLVSDILKKISDLVPMGQGYSHDRIDSNAHAHILASIIGPSIAIPISKGKAALGTWQSVLFIELDGPRNRKVTVQIL